MRQEIRMSLPTCVKMPAIIYKKLLYVFDGLVQIFKSTRAVDSHKI